jgi:lysophospholipase L1-like esterase
LLTTALTLMLIRWLAPQLIGLPVDLQMVQTSKSVPPFFEGIFRKQDYDKKDLLLKDPYTNVRFKPLLPETGQTGPHDILGFRNTAIPHAVDVIAIGDSQTYGFGDAIDDNWPSQLADRLQHPVYSMAVGGWGAIQYLDMFPKAALLGPRVVIVAFYSGNDPLESFALAYGSDHWSSLRVDPDLHRSDAPEVTPVMSMEDSWPVTFQDGIKIVFTPRSRLDINDSEHPAVQAGYEIMAEVARQISALALQQGIEVVFTVIPTRELVYARKVSQDSIEATETYRRLVTMENGNIDKLVAVLRALPAARYVDLVESMQSAALTDASLYPRKWDGHPGPEGYRVIAAALAETVEPLLGLADRASPH